MRCVVTGKPAWNSYNAHSIALTTVISCDETADDSHFTVRGCEGNARSQASQTARGRAVTDSRQRCCSAATNGTVLEPLTALHAHAFRPFSLSAAHLVRGLGFRCEGPNRSPFGRVKTLFSISRSSVTTGARTGLRVPIVSKHVCVRCLISFSSPTCSH